MSSQAAGKAPRVFISTGELSGEMHAANLLKTMQQQRTGLGQPQLELEGNGSVQMQAAGVKLLYDVATWSELGIIRNLFKASFFTRILGATLRHILNGDFQMVVLVDNRFMNLNLAKQLRERGYRGRIVYYVAPVRWESLYDEAERRRSLSNPRFVMIRQHCDLAIPIYPVSLETYEQLEIPHVYPGHPLCELARPSLTDGQFQAVLGKDSRDLQDALIVGIMPGSRRGEISDIAPEIYRAVALLREECARNSQLPRIIAVSPVAHAELREEMLRAAREAQLDELLLIDTQYRYDLMSRAALMIVKSGTGLHECMIMGIPAVMCYRVHPALAWIGRHIMRFSMPFYGFPNLLASKEVVPELIQEDCQHRRIKDVARRLLFEVREREAMLAEFDNLRERVCRPQPLATAARAVNALL